MTEQGQFIPEKFSTKYIEDSTSLELRKEPTRFQRMMLGVLAVATGASMAFSEGKPVFAQDAPTDTDKTEQPANAMEEAIDFSSIHWPGITDGINIQKAVGHLGEIVQEEREKSAQDLEQTADFSTAESTGNSTLVDESASQKTEVTEEAINLAHEIYTNAYSSPNMVRVNKDGLPIMFVAGQLLSSMGEDEARKLENEEQTKNVLTQYLTDKGETAPKTIDPENIVKLAAVLLALDTEQPISLSDGTVLTDINQLTVEVTEKIFSESTKYLLPLFTIGPNKNNPGDTTIYIEYTPQE